MFTTCASAVHYDVCIGVSPRTMYVIVPSNFNNSEPVNGGWTDFGNWTRCSNTCGGGTQTKFRACTNPKPAYGGSDCEGETLSDETRSCNTQLCVPGNKLLLNV